MSTSTDESQPEKEKFDLTPSEQRAGEIFDLVHAVMRHRFCKGFQRLANKLEVRADFTRRMADGWDTEQSMVFDQIAKDIRDMITELERDPRDEDEANDDRE